MGWCHTHTLRVGLLEMSSQRYPELCFPGDSHPTKLIVKSKYLVTVPFYTGRGWVAFHREFWAVALAVALLRHCSSVATSLPIPALCASPEEAFQTAA